MIRSKSLRSIVAIFALAGVASACADAAAASPELTVYATPTCGCCGAWIEHMRENGFDVEVVYQDDLTAIRRAHDVPAEMTSCHMGVVDGFAVEGHVPADVVHRLLAERPPVLGIAVPGMPIGSPGMEHPDGIEQPYEVFTFDESGPREVYEFRN
ncbi:MAG: DUF411 domain-containing protein [Gemmatimonadota bacterium]